MKTIFLLGRKGYSSNGDRSWQWHLPVILMRPLLMWCIVRPGDVYKRQGEGNPDAAEHLRLIEQYKTDEELYQEKLKEWKMYGIE